MNRETVQYWREQAASLPLTALRTEQLEKLRTFLKLRDLGETEECEEWLTGTEQHFLHLYESTDDEEESKDRVIQTAELFLSEGVEFWLEALQLFEEGAPGESVMQSAEAGQRMLIIVQEMADSV